MRLRAKAVGHRGQCYATVKGERLPCAHQANMQADQTYRATRANDAPHDALLKAIQECGKVIVRKSVRAADGKAWDASGYVAVFAVEDAKVQDDVLTFRFVDRLID